MKRSVILAGVLIVLLPLLAYKQYEWLGKVSDAEREKMQTNLRRAAGQFRDDFDREISRVFSSFQAHTTRDDYDPRLVSDVFKVAGAAGDARLERLNPTTKQFETTEWPEDLITFKNAIAGEMHRGSGRMEFFLRFMPPPVDANIPALFIPIMQAPVLEETRLEIMQPSAYQIVRLNLNYIQKELLPDLARIHFPDYRVNVVTRANAKKSIFIAGSSPGPESSGDVKMNFFALRFGGAGDALTATPPAPGSPAIVAGHNSRTQIKVVRGFAVGRRIATEVAIDDNSGAWTLVVTHPAGSLDAAVGQVRRRNLVISSGILLLLVISVAMIVISSQRAQRLAQQQMEFVSAVSHELRTPLAVICSAGENLADGLIDDAAHAREYGALVRNEGRRLTEMVEQVLDFAGIQSGRKTYNLRPTSVREVINTALEACDIQIRERGFTVETHIEDDIPPVMADKPALARAIQNLVSNALKYSGESRWIGVRTSSTPAETVITIEDRGAGIPLPDLPRIFEPFYRGRDAVDAQINGSGLGLSLVKQIVEAHKGTVSVASIEGQGSTFRIVLPRNG